MTRAAMAVAVVTVLGLTGSMAAQAPLAGPPPREVLAGRQAPPPQLTAPVPPPTPMTPPPAAPKGESGYTSLFNGKDLTGWKASGAEGTFKVENGAIQANGFAGPGHLFYDGAVANHQFRNFDLKLDVMAKNKSNGGVYVLTEFQESGFPGKGFEIQVNNSHTDRIRTGSLYHVVDLSHIPAKDDEWFPMEIQVRGQTITVWVKGAQVLQWTQPADWDGAYDTPGRKIAPGTIAFQAHDPNSYTYYANIRIKELK